MTQYGQLQGQVDARLPPDAITVPVGAFSPEWEERPDTEVCIGLRPVPPRDLEDARKAAADRATKLYPDARRGEPHMSLWVDHYHDLLLRSIVARGTCDPNDVREPWEGWRADPDDIARMALTTEGTQLIFDAWERMRAASDVTTQPATDEDLLELADRMGDGDVDRLGRVRMLRARRLLAHVLAELRALPPLPTTP